MKVVAVLITLVLFVSLCGVSMIYVKSEQSHVQTRTQLRALIDFINMETDTQWPDVKRKYKIETRNHNLVITNLDSGARALITKQGYQYK